MFHVSVLRCASCNGILSAKERNRILICNHCNSPNEFRKGDVHKVNVTYASSPGRSPQEQVYVPFWVLDADISISSMKIIGGTIRRFVKGEHSFDGNHRIWITAGTIPESQAEELGFRYSQNQPVYSIGKTPHIPEIPVSCDHGEAMQTAEYFFLKNEVKRSGTLQSIDYSIDFSGYELVYLPFEKKEDMLRPIL